MWEVGLCDPPPTPPLCLLCEPAAMNDIDWYCVHSPQEMLGEFVMESVWHHLEGPLKLSH